MNTKEKQKVYTDTSRSRREKRQRAALDILQSTEILADIIREPARVREDSRFIFLNKLSVHRLVLP